MTKFRSIFLISAVAVFGGMIGGQLSAQSNEGTRSDRIVDLLSRVPTSSFQRGYMLEYGDAQAGLPFLTTDRFQNTLSFAQAAPREIRPMAMMQHDGMKDLMGFDHGDIATIFQVSDAETTALVVELNAGIGSAVFPALEASGYTSQMRGGDEIMARGEDFSLDITAKNVSDMFGGRLGMASRVAVQGDEIVQARDWGTMDAMLSGTDANLAQDVQLLAVIRSLDAPSPILYDATFIRLDAHADRSAQSLGVDAVLVAGFLTQTHDIAVLSMPFSDATIAGQRVQAIQENWPSNQASASVVGLEDLIGRPPVPAIDIIGNSPAVVRLILSLPRDRGTEVSPNAAQRTFNTLMNNGMLPSLIGQN